MPDQHQRSDKTTWSRENCKGESEPLCHHRKLNGEIDTFFKSFYANHLHLSRRELMLAHMFTWVSNNIETVSLHFFFLHTVKIIRERSKRSSSRIHDSFLSISLLDNMMCECSSIAHWIFQTRQKFIMKLINFSLSPTGHVCVCILPKIEISPWRRSEERREDEKKTKFENWIRMNGKNENERSSLVTPNQTAYAQRSRPSIEFLLKIVCAYDVSSLQKNAKRKISHLKKK